MRHGAWVACVLLLAGAGASAQDEDTLRRAFEGRTVTVKIPMPASHLGVDLRFDRAQPFDFSEQADRLGRYDTALREGDRVPVTKVKVKDDLIEFHLAGGGFNWTWQTTTETFTPSPKSDREKDLERDIKKEADRERRDDMQDELDRLRHERERRDDRRRHEVEEHNLQAREVDHERALRSGSRFNVRFKKHVPPDALTPDGLARYLSAWVDFGDGRRRPEDRPPQVGMGWLRKGLTRAEVEERLGRPLRQSPCGGTDLQCLTLVYAGDEETEAEVTFVEGVVVRFNLRSH